MKGISILTVGLYIKERAWYDLHFIHLICFQTYVCVNLNLFWCSWHNQICKIVKRKHWMGYKGKGKKKLTGYVKWKLRFIKIIEIIWSKMQFIFERGKKLAHKLNFFAYKFDETLESSFNCKLKKIWLGDLWLTLLMLLNLFLFVKGLHWTL